MINVILCMYIVVGIILGALVNYVQSTSRAKQTGIEIFRNSIVAMTIWPIFLLWIIKSVKIYLSKESK